MAIISATESAAMTSSVLNPENINVPVARLIARINEVGGKYKWDHVPWAEATSLRDRVDEMIAALQDSPVSAAHLKRLNDAIARLEWAAVVVREKEKEPIHSESQLIDKPAPHQADASPLGFAGAASNENSDLNSLEPLQKEFPPKPDVEEQPFPAIILSDENAEMPKSRCCLKTAMVSSLVAAAAVGTGVVAIYNHPFDC
jgi:hypothetical protein